jgi:hypothetical protein
MAFTNKARNPTKLKKTKGLFKAKKTAMRVKGTSNTISRISTPPTRIRKKG